MKPSIQCWNFFLTKESSSQLHSEYGRPIHLQRYSGSLEDVFLWLWAVYKAEKTGILTDIMTIRNYTNINFKTYKGSRTILMPFLFLLLKNNASCLVGSGVNGKLSSLCVNKDDQRTKSYQLHALPPGTVCSVQRWVPVGSYETLHPPGMLSSTYRQGLT